MDDDMVPYERDAVKFVRQVLEGLLFLHEHNIAHLDIKVKLTRWETDTLTRGPGLFRLVDEVRWRATNR